MLVHGAYELVTRIIEALQEPQHQFILHVDIKSPILQQQLVDYSGQFDNIHVLTDEHRQNISWGGFSIVNATIEAMKYAWSLDKPFDYLIDVSGSTYPIKSNRYIRQRLSEHSNRIYIDMQPEATLPLPEVRGI